MKRTYLPIFVLVAATLWFVLSDLSTPAVTANEAYRLNDNANVFSSPNRDPFKVENVALYLPFVVTDPGASPFLYTDDFSDPGSGWPVWEDAEARVSYQSGEYEVFVKRAGWLWRIPIPAPDLAAATVELDLRLVQGSSIIYGISIDFVERNISYAFFLSETQRFTVQKLANNQWHTIAPWQPSGEIKPINEANRVRIEYGDGTFIFYINDQEVARGSDPDIAGEANSGLFIATDPDDTVPVILRFDNVTIQSESYSPPPVAAACTLAPTLTSPADQSALDSLVPEFVYRRGSENVTYTEISFADNPAFEDAEYYTGWTVGLGPFRTSGRI